MTTINNQSNNNQLNKNLSILGKFLVVNQADANKQTTLNQSKHLHIDRMMNKLCAKVENRRRKRLEKRLINSLKLASLMDQDHQLRPSDQNLKHFRASKRYLLPVLKPQAAL